MDATAPTRPQQARAVSARPAPLRDRLPVPKPRRSRVTDLHRAGLALLLIATALLRLWGIKQGLPYSYNSDEATHFVPRAVGFFSHDLNPQYFLNPPAYSYVLYVVFELWFGSADAVARAYTTNPTEVFVIARAVAALLGTLAVWLTYLAGLRLLDRTVALLAAACFGLAFLPIFYSHLALNDVPTLAPVALALYGVAGVYRRGRLRDYALAGTGIGLAAATKYTGGITLLCLLAACGYDATRPAGRDPTPTLGRDGTRPAGRDGRTAGWPRVGPALGRCAIALLVALAAFVIANPYSVLDFSAFQAGVSQQASLAAGGQEPVKLGSTTGGGIAYYLWTFTWGLGWGPAVAATGGAALLIARRRVALALVLLPAPVAFIVFMGEQQRYFGRWLMPVFPIVALVGAYGAVELARWLARARGVPAPLAGAVVAILMLAQSVSADVRSDEVLSRPDTRNLTRAWMVAHVPAGAKVVIEPVVPDDWATDVGRSLPVTPTGERWARYPTWVTDVNEHGNPLPSGQFRYVTIDEYERTLRPALINEYVTGGYCWVVVGSLQAGRAFAQPRDAPNAIAYYAALASRGRLMYHVSPFGRGANSVPFNFDWSIDYYPPQYRRPGPEMSVYRLTGGDCG